MIFFLIAVATYHLFLTEIRIATLYEPLKLAISGTSLKRTL